MDEITAEQFADRCNATAAAGINVKPAIAAIRDLVLEGIDENFLRRQTADGHAWPKRKDRKTHPLLEKTGALREAATSKAPGHVERIEDNSIELGVEKIELGGLMGALAHQFGYQEGNIPKREYLGISRFTFDGCVAATERTAAEQLTLSWQ